MRSKTRFYIYGLVFLVLLIFIRTWYSEVQRIGETKNGGILSKIIQHDTHSLGANITLLLRYTPNLSNYLLESVNLFLQLYPQISVVIVCDTSLKKALSSALYGIARVKVITLTLDLLNAKSSQNVGNYIRTKYLLSVPIGVSMTSPKSIVSLVEILDYGNVSLLAIPVNHKIPVDCLDLNLNLVQWTIQYKRNDFSSVCDAIKGDHAIFTNSKTFYKIAKPFMSPFPEPLYIQTTALKMKVKILSNVFFKDNKINKTDKFLKDVNMQRQIMHQYLKIKKVIREDGVTDWYGCSRKTSRCFGDVINSVPDYLLEGRWTPPCCLRILREVFHHVNKVFKEYNVTYWLEGGSLLGAMRSSDIIPWDYDIDIGIYSHDIVKCPWLKALKDKTFQNVRPSVLDNEGFVWERSAPGEGEFFRVQASIKNRLHVDIFPFFSRDGTMTKSTWFPDHPQDKEFPEHYLQPLTTIDFAGIKAPAPNNIREFLEFKFGKGCVEDPKYPNPEILSFPSEMKKFVVDNDTKNYEN